MKLEDNIAMVVRVQAMIRGWSERRKYRVLKSNYQNSVKYFKLEESQETLQGKYDPNNKNLVTRTYTYKTGAVYSGTWKGGMRHGKG